MPSRPTSMPHSGSAARRTPASPPASSPAPMKMPSSFQAILPHIDETDLPPALRKDLLENSAVGEGIRRIGDQSGHHRHSRSRSRSRSSTRIQRGIRLPYSSPNDANAALPADKQVAAAEAPHHTRGRARRWLIVTLSTGVLAVACYLVAVIGRSIRISLGKVRDGGSSARCRQSVGSQRSPRVSMRWENLPAH